jgi:hypothetical protein
MLWTLMTAMCKIINIIFLNVFYCETQNYLRKRDVSSFHVSTLGTIFLTQTFMLFIHVFQINFE